MKENFGERLSALIDDECGKTSSTIIEQLINDDEVRKKWARYHLIGDALHGRLKGHHKGVASRVGAELNLQADALKVSPRQRFSAPWMRFSIAASIVVCAIAGILRFNLSVPTHTLELATQQPAQQINDDSPTTDPRLNRYLASYSQHRVHTGIRGVPPHLRMVVNWSDAAP